MITEVALTDTEEATRETVARAVERLQAGEPVALPTETVYGLAADATNPEAVAKIYEVKERPSFDPLIVHLPSRKVLGQFAVVPEAVAPVVDALANAFWPGPFTMLLPRKETIPDLVTAGLPEVAVRLSDHPVFKRIVRGAGVPLAAPSANRFGRISPTSAEAARAELEGRISLVVDGGACARGLESTIVRVLPPDPTAKGKQAKKGKPRIEVLRAGPVAYEDLKAFGIVEGVENRKVLDQAPEAPGMLASHYAPVTPFRLLEDPAAFTPDPNKRYALLSYRGREDDGYLDLTDWDQLAVLSPGTGKLPEAALRLFFLMRQLDASGVDEIIAEPVPERSVGRAMMDRLRRASHAEP